MLSFPEHEHEVFWLSIGATYQASCDSAPSVIELSRFVSPISFQTPEVVVSSGWLEHGAFAFWLIETLAPQKFVELGTHFGYSYFAVCQTVAKLDLPPTCYAVDTWAGDEHAGFYGDAVYKSVVALNEQYKAFSTLLRSTFDNAAQYFPDKSVDLLHIGGLHFYDDVKADFQVWRPKRTDNAIVLFHDTNVRERDFGVWRFFGELKEKHATFEFFHGNGLGVLAIDTVPDALHGLFECGEEETSAVRSIYSQLGANLSQRWAAKDQQRKAQLEAQRLADDLKLLIAGYEERYISLQRNYDNLFETLASAEDAVHTLARNDFLRKSRALVRLPLASSIARFIEHLKLSKIETKTASDEQTIAKIWASGLFQEGYYLVNNPLLFFAGTDPVLHYTRQGWKEGRRPNPFFDPLYYLKQNPEVAKTGENPLLHYAARGWSEGRRPSQEFDSAFYLERYPDVAAAGIEPLRHYLHDGRREGRRGKAGRLTRVPCRNCMAAACNERKCRACTFHFGCRNAGLSMRYASARVARPVGRGRCRHATCRVYVCGGYR